MPFVIHKYVFFFSFVPMNDVFLRNCSAVFNVLRLESLSRCSVGLHIYSRHRRPIHAKAKSSIVCRRCGFRGISTDRHAERALYVRIIKSCCAAR